MSLKFKYLRAAALAGASLACLSGAATAQDQANTQVAAAVGEPERVLITGYLEQDLPQRLAEVGTRVDIVTSAQIQNGGYLDVGQTLQALVPGLYIAPKNGPFDYVDISLQGSRTEDVLWIVDGVRINNRLYGSTTPLDTLPASMIERVEVLEGVQSLFYGTQGIAGAVSIVTKDFSDTPDGQITVGADTNSLRHFDGYFRDTLNGRHHFVVYGSADKSEGYQAFPDEDLQPSQTDRKRSFEVLTIGGKYAFDLNNDLRFSVSEQHTDAKLDFLYPQGAVVAYNERNEDILSAKIDYTPTQGVQFFLKGYYHWWYAYFTEFDNELDDEGNITGNVITIDNHDFWGFTDYGVSAVAKFVPTTGVETYLGYDYQNYTGSDAVLFIEKQTEHVHAFFAEIATTRDLIRNVQFAAGIRYNSPNTAPSVTVWNVSARWDISDAFYLKGMVGTGFRLPTAEELFAKDPPQNPNYFGNPDTKPERSTNLNVSVGGYLGANQSINWEVVGFFRDIDDLIDTTFDDVLEVDVFGNVPGTVEVRGGEAILNAAFTDEFSGSFSYTYQQSHDPDGLQIRRVPEQLAKAAIDYHPLNTWFGLFASLNYVGRTFDTIGGVRTEYGNYVVVDIGARAFLDMERHHRISLNLFNVFDENYTTRLTRGFPDNGDPAYTAHNLGLPRTLAARYSYSF
jgi:vitamin B12 transporter